MSMRTIQTTKCAPCLAELVKGNTFPSNRQVFPTFITGVPIQYYIYIYYIGFPSSRNIPIEFGDQPHLADTDTAGIRWIQGPPASAKKFRSLKVQYLELHHAFADHWFLVLGAAVSYGDTLLAMSWKYDGHISALSLGYGFNVC